MTETAAPALSIVVPVYNGAASIGELVGALEGLDIPGGHEIVLVNDGSPDNSLAVCRELVARAKIPITLIDHARNYGEHNAVMTGCAMRAARMSSTWTTTCKTRRRKWPGCSPMRRKPAPT